MKLELLSHLPKHNTNKPPLLFLHGMGFGAWCWEEYFLPWFAAQGYPAYAMSLRGHGKSWQPKSLRWTRLEDYKDDVAQIYESFDQPPVLIGHSMGGFIVQKFLAEHNFRDNRLPPAVILLTSTPSNGILGIAWQTLLNFPRPALKVLLKASARPLLDHPDIFQKTLLSKSVPLAKIKRYSLMTGDESLRAFATLMFVSSPKRLENPPHMLVIGAQNDAYIPAIATQNTARYYRCDCKILPDLGHLVMLDTNWEKCAIELKNWIEEQGI